MLHLIRKDPWRAPCWRLNPLISNSSTFGGEKRPLHHLVDWTFVQRQMFVKKFQAPTSCPEKLRPRQPSMTECCWRIKDGNGGGSSRAKSTMTFSERVAAARAKRAKINDQSTSLNVPGKVPHSRDLEVGKTIKPSFQRRASQNDFSFASSLDSIIPFGREKKIGNNIHRTGTSRQSNNRPSDNRRFMPSVRDMHSFDQAIESSFNQLMQQGKLSPPNTAAFWSNVPRLLKCISSNGQTNETQLAAKLKQLIEFTEKNIEYFNQRYLTQTVLGLAKAAIELKELRAKSTYRHSVHWALHEFLSLDNLNQRDGIFSIIAATSRRNLSKTEPRHLANQAYAYSIIEFVPRFEDGTSLFDHIATASSLRLDEFKSQHVSNLVYAYAKTGEKNHDLFQKVEHQISCSHILQEFTPQDYSMVAWAFAKNEESNPRVFEKIGNEIVSLDDLGSFKCQELSNILWAFAKIGAPHLGLFQRIGDEIENRALCDFLPQELASIAWAFATVEEPRPTLFQKIGDEIISLGNLDEFDSQTMANVLYAFSVTGTQHPVLFQIIGDHIVSLHDLSDFEERHFAMILVSFAKHEIPYPRLFQKVGDHIVATSESDVLESFNAGEISSIAWSFVSSNEAHPELFKKFEKTLVERRNEFTSQEISTIRWACSSVSNK